MMDNFDTGKAANILADCVSSVFADMAFIDVLKKSISTTQETASGDAAQAETLPPGGEMRRAAIDVLAPLSCRIELQIDTALRDRIVDTLFGDLSAAGQKKTAEDSLLEMLNIIAGSFLSGYFGPGTEIQLELPRYLYQEDQSQGQTIARISMDAEGEPVTILLASVRYRY